MPERSLELIVESIVRALQHEDISHFFGGELGVRVWGLAGPAYDVDVTVAADEARLQRLLTRLEEEAFIVPPLASSGWIDAGDGVPGVRVAREAGGRLWEAALYVASLSQLQSAMERRRRATMGGMELWMISPEDLILNRLQVGTNKALLQAVEILAVTGPIDKDYLKKWAKELDVEFQLSEVLCRSQSFE